jgi:hypothetical protein
VFAEAGAEIGESVWEAIKSLAAFAGARSVVLSDVHG